MFCPLSDMKKEPVPEGYMKSPGFQISQRGLSTKQVEVGHVLRSGQEQDVPSWRFEY